MTKSISFIYKQYDLFFSFLILVLPFSKAIPNLILGMLVIMFSFDIKKKELNQFFKLPYFILTILILFLFCQALINNSFIQDIGFYQRYLYLIIIPILFLKVKNHDLLKKVSLVTINSTILISGYYIFEFYKIYNFIPMGDGWSTNKVLLLERPYAGIFSVISIILSFNLIRKKDKFKFLYLASLLLSMFFIFFISIRISIIIVLVLVLIYLLFYLKINFLKKLYFFAALITICILIFSLNKNISKRFFISGTIEKTMQQINKSEPRVVIWGCANEITKQPDFSVLFGTNSYTNIKTSLVNCYENNIEDFSRKSYFLDHKYNTHSQFIDFYLIGGLLTIILFLLFFIKSLLYNYKDFCSVAMVISFFLFLLIENVFHRQFGCFIFAIFTSLYLIKPKTNE